MLQRLKNEKRKLQFIIFRRICTPVTRKCCMSRHVLLFFCSFWYRLYNERRWSRLHMSLVKWQQVEIEDFTGNKLITWSKNSEIFATRNESCDSLMKFEKLIIVVMKGDVFQRQAMNFVFIERFPNQKIHFLQKFQYLHNLQFLPWMLINSENLYEIGGTARRLVKLGWNYTVDFGINYIFFIYFW